MNNYNIYDDRDTHNFYVDGCVYHKRLKRFVIGSNIGGYRQCRYQGKKQYIHRLIWLKFKGEIPDGFEIDHINDIKFDNRLENLQLLTRAENIAKQLLMKSNTSGYIGVSFKKKANKWQARFQSKDFNGGKSKSLGYFKTAIEAARARDAFIIKNGFNHHCLNNFSS